MAIGYLFVHNFGKSDSDIILWKNVWPNFCVKDFWIKPRIIVKFEFQIWLNSIRFDADVRVSTYSDFFLIGWFLFQNLTEILVMHHWPQENQILTQMQNRIKCSFNRRQQTFWVKPRLHFILPNYSSVITVVELGW